MPKVEAGEKVGPVNYASAFTGFDPPVPGGSVRAFGELTGFIKADQYLRDRLLNPHMQFKDPEAAQEAQDWLLEMQARHIPLQLIDRYVHVTNSWDFTEMGFHTVYEPYARVLFSDTLSFDIHVPVLFVRFPDRPFELTPNIVIAPIDPGMQIARLSIRAYLPYVHDAVVAAATHAVVLKNYSVENQGEWSLNTIFHKPSAYPLDVIDAAFAALRVVTGVHTGYAQLLIRPHDWAIGYKADLPPLEGTSVRAYPDRFERWYWLVDPLPSVDESELAQIAHTYAGFEAATENSMRIALGRLNRCHLREADADIALDATIGLEALLSDGEPQEITHKLALRAAALSRLWPHATRSPAQVFREIKKIYAHRSAIVHGSSRPDRTREIKLPDERRVDATDLAVEYLRMALHVLAVNERLRDPRAIDAELLLADPGQGCDPHD